MNLETEHFGNDLPVVRFHYTKLRQKGDHRIVIGLMKLGQAGLVIDFEVKVPAPWNHHYHKKQQEFGLGFHKIEVPIGEIIHMEFCTRLFKNYVQLQVAHPTLLAFLPGNEAGIVRIPIHKKLRKDALSLTQLVLQKRT
jgi:hypothetical protein